MYAAPTASLVLTQFTARFDIEAFADAFGLTEACAPILSPCGEIRPTGAAGLVASDWFEIRLVDPDTDREVPTGEIGELRRAVQAPMDVQHRLLRHASQDRSGSRGHPHVCVEDGVVSAGRRVRSKAGPRRCLNVR